MKKVFNKKTKKEKFESEKTKKRRRKEASENEIAEYNARIGEELYGNTRFIDVPLDYSDDDGDGAVDRVIDERSRLYEYASNFKASNRTLRSARFFKWSTEKKKVKGHYYSWD